jgi:ATP-dependent DNA helicase RecG
MTESEFWDAAGVLETAQLDFKSGPPPDMHADIAALAMTNGGLLILGVTESRTVKGCNLSQRVHDKIHRASHECGVEVQAREVSVEGAPVVLVAVPEIRGRIVTTPNGRLLRRVGSDNQPLVGDAMARFVRERSELSSEEEHVPSVDLHGFDTKMLNIALRSEGRPNVRRDSVVRGLIDLGLAVNQPPPSDPAVRRAAVLLFGSSTDPFAAKVQIVRRVGVGPGPGPTADRRELRGNIPALVESTIAWILEHTNRYSVVVGTQRETWPEYPATALREAILNALAHRDYGLSGASVDVSIWDDRIEIQSPGPLPGHITLENIRQEHYSRNPRVMRVLKSLGLVEEYGEGVDRMFSEMEARLMEPPIFNATGSSVTVTLRNRFLVDVEQQAWLALLGHVELSAAERRILIAARSRQGEGVTPRGLRDILGPGVNVPSLLSGLVAKSLLVRVGERGGTRYVLSDEVVMRAGATGVEARTRKRQILLDEMRKRGRLSTAEASDLLSEDMATVRHLLNDLVRADLAQARGNTRGRRYYPI